MVLGLGSKKKGTTVKVEFYITVQEIKPWKAASGRNTPLLVQWQRGDNRYGKTRSAMPVQEDGGKVVFNDSFKLPAKLVREPEGKGRNAGVPKFQKKTVVFIVQEATTDLQLARCVVDLAEYGDVDSRVPASVPLAMGKKFVSGGQTPALFLSIGLYQKKEERGFSSRVSFGSSTPRSSISRAPEKPTDTGKARVEATLDEDTRKSIVAALMSDEDDDHVSIESFTDDEGTTEDSTSVSEATTKSTTPGSETPSRKFSSTSSRPETPNSVNKPGPSSQQSASQTSTLSSSPMTDTSKGRPTQTTHGPATAIHSSMLPSEERVHTTRPIPTKHGSGKGIQSPRTSLGERPESSRASTQLVTQLFSSEPVYKTTNAASESVSHVKKELTESSGASSAPESQANEVLKRPSSPENRKEASRAVLLSTETSSIASKGNKISVTSPEAPRIVSELTDSNDSGSGADKTAGENVDTAHANTSKHEGSAEREERPKRNAALLPPASAKAAAAAAATAYVAKRTFKASRGSSFDYSYDSSEDSLSESSKSGRSPPQTPLRDETHVLELSVSSSEMSGDGKGSYNNEGKGKVEDKNAVQKDEDLDGSKTVDSKSPDSKKVRGAAEAKAETRVATGAKAETRGAIEAKPEIRGATGAKAETRGAIEAKAEIRGATEAMTESRGAAEAKAETLIKEEIPDDEKEREGEGASVLGSARANLAKMEKKALDELRHKIAISEAKFLDETKKVAKLEGELRDTGAMEVALYSVVAEHGNSSHKLHTPARRLARLYLYSCKHWSPERRAGTAKNCVSGLVTVAKACGTDVSRLTFWWSNVVTLRTVITQAFDTGSSSLSQAENSEEKNAGSINRNVSTGWAKARKSVNIRSSFTRQISKLLTTKPLSTDWRESSTFTAALEKIEDWIFTKIVESLWWQAMIPRMQKNVDASAPTSPRGISLLSPSAIFGSEFATKAKEDLNKLAGEVTGMFIKKFEKKPASLPELGDARQGNMSVDVWKKAIMEALRRLCPVRGAGHDCGCLPMLIKMAIEGCVARLDVALFNGILREPADDVPTDPLADPISDSSVLPISPGGLTFGGGSQLKNVVVTWSTFISGLVSIKEPAIVPDLVNGDNTDNSEDSEKSPKFFNLLKATGDLLMLPKDILMDKAIRKEICPMLSLQLIRRILLNFVPDEFAPDPISPSLLAALNAEAIIEKQRQGEADEFSSVPMAAAPPVTYVAPSVYYVWSWIGEASTDPIGWGRNNNSLLRKGYTSDEDLDVLEKLQKSSASDKLEFLMGVSRQGSPLTSNGNHPDDSNIRTLGVAEEVSASRRFQLLKEVWGT